MKNKIKILDLLDVAGRSLIFSIIIYILTKDFNLIFPSNIFIGIIAIVWIIIPIINRIKYDTKEGKNDK